MSDRIDEEIGKLVGKRVSTKKRINSCKKGKTFERTIAKLLTETIGIEVARVPQSGAFSTTHDSDTFSGDLMAVHKNDFMPFCLECKHYREINLFDVLNQNKKTNDIFEWIHQSELEGKATGKKPYIIFKMNNSQIYIMSHMSNFQPPIVSGTKYPLLINDKLRIIFFYNDTPYVITPFSNFEMRKLYDLLKNPPKSLEATSQAL